MVCFLHGVNDEQPYAAAVEKIQKIDPRIKVPPLEKLPLAGIVGRANADQYVTEYDSGWFEGPVGIVISKAKALPFVKCPGKLGWFPCPADVVAALKQAIVRAARTAPPQSTPPRRGNFDDAF